MPQAGHETVRTLRALGRLAEAKAAERQAKELRRWRNAAAMGPET